MQIRQIITVAAKEFRDRIRNRWVLVVAMIFALFALVIAYMGGAQQGSVGFQSIGVVIASLVSLVIYLIPLIALILGFDAIVGERERGSLGLLLAMPITRFELLMGKFAGLSAALALSTLVGFGLVALVLLPYLTPAEFMQFFGFIVSSIVLGLIFISLALLVSVVSQERTQASGLAIGAWFFFVLIFDLILMGGLVASGGNVTGEWLPALLLLNPTDVFRILNLFALEDVRAMFGLATVLPPALSQPGLLMAVMLLWIAAPLAIATWRFKE
ncbi:Probable permease involved in multi-copper enzyme maturation [gamma proteobacterium HdN1]|nr:Probable permease involved in multi-copper enzyme maturation [gamma proteobacterium HdN1]